MFESIGCRGDNCGLRGKYPTTLCKKIIFVKSIKLLALEFLYE